MRKIILLIVTIILSSQFSFAGAYITIEGGIIIHNSENRFGVFKRDDDYGQFLELNINDPGVNIYYGNNTVGRAESYEMAKCPDGLARWDFEEGSGTTVYDSMSDKYHGTFVNMDDTNYVSTPGIQGDHALSFNGNNEFIALNMSFNYQGGDPYNLTTISGPIY